MKRSTVTTAALAATLLLAGLGAGQPGGGGKAGEPPQPGAAPGGTAQPSNDPKVLRKLIETRLDEHRQGIKRLEEALKKLEDGGDPVAIGRELLERRFGNRQDRGGAAGDGARPGQAPGTTGGGAGGNERRSEYDLTGPRLSDEDHAKVLELLDKKYPELLKKANSLADGNEDMKKRLIDGVGSRMRWLEAAREREKDTAEFDLRAKDVSTGLDVLMLGRAITEARKNNDKVSEKAAREKLQKVMDERFDTRQQLSRLKLEQLRKQADELEKQLKKNDETREAVVQKRTEDFLRLMENREKKNEPANAKP